MKGRHTVSTSTAPNDVLFELVARPYVAPAIIVTVARTVDGWNIYSPVTSVLVTIRAECKALVRPVTISSVVDTRGTNTLPPVLSACTVIYTSTEVR